MIIDAVKVKNFQRFTKYFLFKFLLFFYLIDTQTDKYFYNKLAHIFLYMSIKNEKKNNYANTTSNPRLSAVLYGGK